jgi:glycosyltransferase involved in cell wall biosynthesis
VAQGIAVYRGYDRLGALDELDGDGIARRHVQFLPDHGNRLYRIAEIRSRGKDAAYAGQDDEAQVVVGRGLGAWAGPVRGKEKGVLLMKYSDTAAKVMLRYDLNKIMQDYYLVIEPSFSGYCTAEVLSLMELKGTKSLIQCPHKTDYDFIMRAGRSLVPVETGSNSWVDDRVFTDLSLPKEYDCIMVALWGDIKRHYLLFEAMKKINDPSYRVCLIGGPWGRLQKDIEELAEYYGVRDRIDFFEKLPPAEVNRLLNKSKVNALLSLKEGANKAIVEGFFANVPALAMEENLAIGTSYINEFTGRLTSREKLAETLLWFCDNYTSFQHRKWAL